MSKGGIYIRNPDNNLDIKIREIEDRIALKNLVDTFSILTDVKDVDKQVLLLLKMQQLKP
jgi:hypothetical protein